VLVEPALIQKQKTELRRMLRERRRQLDAEKRSLMNKALNLRLQKRFQSIAPCRVAAYLAFDGEPDISPSFLALQQAGFQLALPFIERNSSSKHMIFRRWAPSDELAKNNLGFSEPSGGDEVAPSELGVILMPLVGWDTSGARLGMGAGYYDRTLEDIRAQATPLRIGIAFDVQQSGQIPVDPHDVPLHELITDGQRFTFPA
jgi:5-formyltetrahydrofolate cyclo-ligase